MATSVDIVMQMIRSRDQREAQAQQITSDVIKNQQAQQKLQLDTRSTKIQELLAAEKIRKGPETRFDELLKRSDLLTKAFDNGVIDAQTFDSQMGPLQAALSQSNAMQLQRNLGNVLNQGDPDDNQVAGGVSTPPSFPKGVSSSTNPNAFLPSGVTAGTPSQQRIAQREQAAEAEAQKEVEGVVLKQQEKALEERIRNATQSGEEFGTFSQTYQVALAEALQKIGPEVDDATAVGFALRLYGKAMKGFGLLPEVGAFEQSIDAFATPLAKSAGEDRLTNEDIIRFKQLLPTVLGQSSEQNISEMRNLILKIRTQGGDVSQIMDTFSKSGGALGKVVNAVNNFEIKVGEAGRIIDANFLPEFSSRESINPSNLKDGQMIMVGGKKLRFRRKSGK